MTNYSEVYLLRFQNDNRTKCHLSYFTALVIFEFIWNIVKMKIDRSDKKLAPCVFSILVDAFSFNVVRMSEVI